MPDISGLVHSLAVALPDLSGAFWRGGEYAIGGFLLLGIIYFVRRYV